MRWLAAGVVALVVYASPSAAQREYPPFDAELLDDSGARLAVCHGESRRFGCALRPTGSPHGAARLRLVSEDDRAEVPVGLRGSEELVDVTWPGFRPPHHAIYVTRRHRAPAGLTLSLADAATRHAAYPTVRVASSMPVTVLLERTYASFYGRLAMSDGTSGWAYLPMRRRCDGMVFTRHTIAPGEHHDVVPITYATLEDLLAPTSRFRFDVDVDLEDPEDWNREAAALGAWPLPAEADDADIWVHDVIDLELEATGAEILAAQAVVPADVAGATSEPRWRRAPKS